MTKKRFIPIFDGFNKRVVGAKDNGRIISFMDMFDLLNALHEENENLKAEVYILQDDILNKRVRNLREENKQLKSEINGLEELLKSYRKTIKHNAELLADATKKGYLPPLENWREYD